MFSGILTFSLGIKTVGGTFAKKLSIYCTKSCYTTMKVMMKNFVEDYYMKLASYGQLHMQKFYRHSDISSGCNSGLGSSILFRDEVFKQNNANVPIHPATLYDNS